MSTTTTETNPESIFFKHLNLDVYCKARHTIEKNIHLAKGDTLSTEDRDIIANAILHSNGITALSVWAMLQKNTFVLFAVHPLISKRMVSVATGEGIDPEENKTTRDWMNTSDDHDDTKSFRTCREAAYASYLSSIQQKV